jgi:hypothetical protein
MLISCQVSSDRAPDWIAFASAAVSIAFPRKRFGAGFHKP